jgi:hypothetical protein
VSWTPAGEGKLRCSLCQVEFATGAHCDCTDATQAIQVEVAPHLDTYEDVDPAVRPLLTKRGCRLALAHAAHRMMEVNESGEFVRDLTDVEIRRCSEMRKTVETLLTQIRTDEEQAEVSQLRAELSEVKAALTGKAGSAKRRQNGAAEAAGGSKAARRGRG